MSFGGCRPGGCTRATSAEATATVKVVPGIPATHGTGGDPVPSRPGPPGSFARTGTAALITAAVAGGPLLAGGLFPGPSRRGRRSH